MIAATAVLAGGLMYYLQVYAFYEEIADDGSAVQLVPLGGGLPEVIPYDDFQAIDADSAPIRYRACFTVPVSLPTLTETYELYDGAEPRVAPSWFDCFDAQAIGEAVESGEALVFLSEKNVHYGVDRVVAVFADGRAYAWHELNDCGEKAFDGTVVGEECPPRDGDL